jgi:hypothetical protein
MHDAKALVQLCALLEADIRVLCGRSGLVSTYQDDEEKGYSPTSPVILEPRQGSGRSSFISYDTFLDEYWSHFSQSLTRGLGWYQDFSITNCS